MKLSKEKQGLSFGYELPKYYRSFASTWLAAMLKFLGRKGSFELRRELNPHRIFYVHELGLGFQKGSNVLYTNMAIVTSRENTSRVSSFGFCFNI